MRIIATAFALIALTAPAHAQDDTFMKGLIGTALQQMGQEMAKDTAQADAPQADGGLFDDPPHVVNGHRSMEDPSMSSTDHPYNQEDPRFNPPNASEIIYTVSFSAAAVQEARKELGDKAFRRAYVDEYTTFNGHVDDMIQNVNPGVDFHNPRNDGARNGKLYMQRYIQGMENETDGEDPATVQFNTRATIKELHEQDVSVYEIISGGW